jgi:hypothetical protein
MSATVTHSNGAKAAATNAVTALIGASGFLRFHPTGSTVTTPGTNIASLPFSATAFAAANSTTGIATANAITSDTNATGGTVAFASFQTSAGSAIVHCAVAASASDINMTGGLVVASGDTVSCSALTYAALSQ